MKTFRFKLHFATEEDIKKIFKDAVKLDEVTYQITSEKTNLSESGDMYIDHQFKVIFYKEHITTGDTTGGRWLAKVKIEGIDDYTYADVICNASAYLGKGVKFISIRKIKTYVQMWFKSYDHMVEKLGLNPIYKAAENETNDIVLAKGDIIELGEDIYIDSSFRVQRFYSTMPEYNYLARISVNTTNLTEMCRCLKLRGIKYNYLTTSILCHLKLSEDKINKIFSVSGCVEEVEPSIYNIIMKFRAILISHGIELWNSATAKYIDGFYYIDTPLHFESINAIDKLEDGIDITPFNEDEIKEYYDKKKQEFIQKQNNALNQVEEMHDNNQISINENDSPELKALKQIILDKNINIESYKERFGPDYPQNVRLLKDPNKNSITLDRMKEICNALDMQIEINFK